MKWTSLTAVVAQVNQSPEFWAFVVTNLLTLVLGAALTVIAFIAYRREDLSAFLIVTVGFALTTLGTIVEIVYEASAKDFINTGITAFGRELLLLRAFEGALIAGGLFLLLYSFRHV